jgi:hypothetical protein
MLVYLLCQGFDQWVYNQHVPSNRTLSPFTSILGGNKPRSTFLEIEKAWPDIMINVDGSVMWACDSAIAGVAVAPIRAAVGVAQILAAVAAIEGPIGAVNAFVVPFLALDPGPILFAHWRKQDAAARSNAGSIAIAGA